MEPQKEFSKWESVYVSFKADSIYRGAIGIVAGNTPDRILVDLWFWEENIIGLLKTEIHHMGWFSYIKEWVLDKLQTILTIIFVGILCVSAYLMASNPSKPDPKDQVLEIGKVISSLQDKKYVQLSNQRELKRKLEASYMEVSKIDAQIIAKREEMMELVNPSDSNLSIQFNNYVWE